MADLRMLFPNGLMKALTLSYDDGVEQDARLLGIMNHYGLKGTFNLNSSQFAPEGTVYPEGQIHRRMTEKATVELLANSGQEVAIHACYHGDLPALPAAHAVWQVVRDKEQLENLFGRIVRGMAYPYGTYSTEFTHTLRDCGVAYARTVHSTHRFDLPSDWLTLPATCHHNDPELMNLAKAFVEQKPWRAQLFYLWGHSYEFEADNNWNVIEAFAEYIGGRDDIWYATNIQIHDYVEAWRSMHISADGRRFHNPSAMPLWLDVDRKVYCIESGGDLAV
ncbi:MAG: polysaccharide deacetylase family protein [Clostridia bacterium]|nr:polysaccharide deacetylase family protein [Clostridia bacterium]